MSVTQTETTGSRLSRDAAVLMRHNVLHIPFLSIVARLILPVVMGIRFHRDAGDTPWVVFYDSSSASERHLAASRELVLNRFQNFQRKSIEAQSKRTASRVLTDAAFGSVRVFQRNGNLIQQFLVQYPAIATFGSSSVKARIIANRRCPSSLLSRGH
jgi:hypothetical protein